MIKSEQRFLTITQQFANGAAEDDQNQLDCFRSRWETSSYPEFNRWVYSLDTLLPVLAMGQKVSWRPNPQEPGGRFTINYYYFQSVIGWILSLLGDHRLFGPREVVMSRRPRSISMRKP